MVSRLLLLLVVLLLLPASAAAQEEFPEQPRTAPRTDSPIVEKGPCFDTAVASLPDGKGHNHNDNAQHDFTCGLKQEAHLPLTDVLAARPDVMLGESDVANDVAAVAVAYPEAGILLFDVKDPAKPVFKSWYRGGDCDTAVLDTDCGAYLSLSDDGKTAFLSIQAASPLGNGGFNGTTPTTAPGVQVVDISNLEQPLLTDFMPVAGVNGVHTANFHTIETGPAAGEYLFITQNSVGIQIARVVRSGGAAKLTPGPVIRVDEVHDTFIQEDPTDKKTYMYIAAGNTSGFYVYDVTNPVSSTLLAEWDLRPECHQDWYAHTIDVTTVKGRRIVTMPTEGFYFGTQPTAETEAGCGEVYGNGDKPGVMWIVDATDLSKLGPANAEDGNDPPDPELGKNSKAALISTWTHAANAAYGNLKFGAHNQAIFGDHILMSAYHAGVIVVNAKAAFEGRNERPFDAAVTIPHSSSRPIFKPSRPPVNGAFISSFFASSGDVWDANFYKGYILAYDEHGGMYSYKFDPTLVRGDDGGKTITGPAGCADTTRPAAKLSRVRLTRKLVSIRGTASDRACGKTASVARVAVSVSRKTGKRCTFLLRSGKFTKPGPCGAARGFQLAKGGAAFSFSVKGKVPRGRYTVRVSAVDGAGNASRGPTRSVRVR